MLSPDPVTQSPDNGQNYDRYTYAFNNPLRYADPSGYRSTGSIGTNLHQICDGTERSCGGLLGGLFTGGGAGVNHTAGYDSLDGLLDFLFGDYDHLLQNSDAPDPTGGGAGNQ
ncbi:MAG: hypothetical protein AAF223_18590, partial [Bacteroidota bacterium]